MVTVVGAFAVATVAFLAGRATLQPVESPDDAKAADVIAVVRQQSVGRVLNMNVTVSQATRPLAVNFRTGVVTSIAGGGPVRQGSVLYRVANRPVVAIAGTMPFYRALSVGKSGQDVVQLRRALVEAKLLGSAGRTFDEATLRALRAWQKRVGWRPTGRLELGDAVAVADLPGVVSLDRKVLRKGAVLSGGEELVFGRVGRPAFSLVVGQEQAALIPATATITMTYRGATWKAVVAESAVAENGETRIVLTAGGGRAVCGSNCDLVSGGSDIYVPATVQIIPPVEGPAVPVAAVVTNTDGTAAVTVIADDGAASSRAVTIRGSQDGVAVVDGVTVGERVLVVPGPSPSPSR
ncbi:peptidoglycan-binding protein [Micropruina sp.]|uniref:peptidoglycan-binding protein n=1 Tax=Micropruina sp. TaxID=2737536 RepID=UPI0039E6C8F1